MNNEDNSILNFAKDILANRVEYKFQLDYGNHFSERCIETPWVASRVKKYHINKILDIGFTMSSLDYLGLLIELNKKYCIGIDAVDIIDPDRVKSRYPKEWISDIFSIPITIGDIRKIKLPLNAYDAVLCISTIEHIGFDEASINDKKTAFKRCLKPEEVNLNRNANTNNDLMNIFYSTLKSKGFLIISVPFGKGGSILLRDSLGYYTCEWEYNESSWNEILLNPKFDLIESFFFKLLNNGTWIKCDGPESLKNQSSELSDHAKGCSIALLQKK